MLSYVLALSLFTVDLFLLPTGKMLRNTGLRQMYVIYVTLYNLYNVILITYCRNQYYVDGGLSDNLPRENTTIAVQPWQGEADISPKDGKFSYSELNFTFANCNIDVTPDNILRFSQMLFPSTVEGNYMVFTGPDSCRSG